MDFSRTEWRRAFVVYMGLIAIGNFAWETLQLPLYTIWSTGNAREQAFAVVHCTVGDILIALASLSVAVLLVGRRGFGHVAALTIAFGVAYTGLSEWLNVSVWRTWAYSEWMPVISLGRLRIGLSPILQWIVIPASAFWTLRRRAAQTYRKQ